MDYLNTTLRAEIKLQPISEIMSRSQKVLQFNSPLNKQDLDVIGGEQTSLVWNTLNAGSTQAVENIGEKT